LGGEGREEERGKLDKRERDHDAITLTCCESSRACSSLQIPLRTPSHFLPRHRFPLLVLLNSQLHLICMSNPTSPPPLPTPSGPSPLKQLNQQGAPPPRSKLEASWLDLSSNPHLFTTTNSPNPARYFAEFFCLKPQLRVQREAVEKLSVEDLLGPYKVRSPRCFPMWCSSRLPSCRTMFPTSSPTL
jgi:hypothetical protein